MIAAVEQYWQDVPDSLRPMIAQYWQRYAERLAELSLPEIPSEAIPDTLKVWAVSDYVTEICLSHPEVLYEIVTSADLKRTLSYDQFIERMQPYMQDITLADDFDVAIRKFRRVEMMRIMWRDILHFGSFEDITTELSHLADLCVQETLAFHERKLAERFNIEAIVGKQKNSMMVIALGKLGGVELNLSSDIDLMFVYASRIEKAWQSQEISCQEFYTRVGQRLIKTLGTVTEHGFVFRVDLRLRPFGTAGSLVLSEAAMRKYYQEHGRDWERYALVRARIVTGLAQDRELVAKIINEFVYRRYLDYSAINALREMKTLIDREAQAKGLEGNIKRGPGGIRELEFSVQVFQLTRGGREQSLQQINLLATLKALHQLEYIADDTYKFLKSAYIFLRNCEHKLQALQDHQTQKLPKEDHERARLAYGMSFSDWDSFCVALDEVRKSVKKYFVQIFESPKSNTVMGQLVTTQAQLQQVWLEKFSVSQCQIMLAGVGYKQPAEVFELARAFRHSKKFKESQKRNRKLINILMPLILYTIVPVTEQLKTLERILPIIEAILSKRTYIHFLIEDNNALGQLVALCNASPWVADQFATYPVLLDDLSNSRTLYAPLDQATLEAQLRQTLVGIPQDELEDQMNALRRFKHTHVLRVAAADIMDILPLMKVSDHLTFTASAIVHDVQNIALQDMLAKHGRPRTQDNHLLDVEFGVIAYGKLGGIELGYGSDLDLVFVRDELDKHGTTDGTESVANQVFYTRLAQRIIYLLSAATVEGRLYEVDTRLRPSGDQGQLVNSIEAYKRYLLERAWTWEHQALVRAQIISGTEQLREQFRLVRAEVLSQQRDIATLREDVLNMRQRMRDANPKAPDGQFDVKDSPGGITDLEFIVQFGVLAWSHQHPGLLIYPDNIRILESFVDAGLLSSDDMKTLCDAYKAYRRVVHHNDLLYSSSMVARQDIESYREAVLSIWQRWLGRTLK